LFLWPLSLAEYIVEGNEVASKAINELLQFSTSSLNQSTSTMSSVIVESSSTANNHTGIIAGVVLSATFIGLVVVVLIVIGGFYKHKSKKHR